MMQSVVLIRDELVECIESRRAKLIRMASSMLDDPAEAEDVIQEAALNALKAASSFRGDADVCTWFQRICLNSAYQALRKRTSAANLEKALELEHLWRDPGYTVDPAAVVVALEDEKKMIQAMKRLTADQRTAVVLHDLHGFNAREIAYDLGLSLPTVKSHLRRGRQALVSRLAETT
jgi:RNA polymerase sigma-70 factor (ECF subfamily)